MKAWYFTPIFLKKENTTVSITSSSQVCCWLRRREVRNLFKSIWKGTTSWRLIRSQSMSMLINSSITLSSRLRLYTYLQLSLTSNVPPPVFSPKKLKYTCLALIPACCLGSFSSTSGVQSHRPPSSLNPSSCCVQISSRSPGLRRRSNKSVPPAVTLSCGLSWVSVLITCSLGISIFVRDQAWHVFTSTSIVYKPSSSDEQCQTSQCAVPWLTTAMGCLSGQPMPSGTWSYLLGVYVFHLGSGARQTIRCVGCRKFGWL